MMKGIFGNCSLSPLPGLFRALIRHQGFATLTPGYYLSPLPGLFRALIHYQGFAMLTPGYFLSPLPGLLHR